MTVFRVVAVVALLCSGAAGCAVGGPERASDIQNLNAITDDISATTMTDSGTRWTYDPNIHSTLPNHYETYDLP